MSAFNKRKTIKYSISKVTEEIELINEQEDYDSSDEENLWGINSPIFEVRESFYEYDEAKDEYNKSYRYVKY